METFYFDSSAIVKLYLPETGSRWVESVISQRILMHASVAISNIAIVETAAAVARQERMGAIVSWQKDLLFQKFLEDSKVLFEMLAIDDELVFETAHLTRHLPLRGYDAVHLATAYRFNAVLDQAGLAPLVFVSADRALLDAARRIGLKTIDPNDMES